jgi:hypothetical protein
MKKKGFTPERIITIFREAKAWLRKGRPLSELERNSAYRGDILPMEERSTEVCVLKQAKKLKEARRQISRETMPF